MTTKVTIKIFVNNNYLLDINTNVIIYFRKRIVKKKLAFCTHCILWSVNK